MTDMDIYSRDDAERTEKATPARVKKARKEGKVAKSGELTAVVSVLAAVVFLFFWGRYMVTELKWLLGRCVELAVDDEFSWAKLAAAGLGSFCRGVLPLLVAVFCVTLACELAQAGFQFSWKPLSPSWDKLRRQRSSTRTGFQLGHALLKVTAAGIVLTVGIRTQLPAFCAMLDNPLESSSRVFVIMAVKVLASVALVLLALAAVEYIAERKFFAESLKMTRREVLEEMKQESGDPVIKDILRSKYEKQ